MHVEIGSRQGRRLLGPRHRRNEGGVEVKVLREGIDTFRVVCKELRTEESASKSELSQDVHLAGDSLQRPVFLTRMKHIDGETRSHDTTIAVLTPVDGERIKVVALEVHHREEGIHESVAQPALGILTHGGVGIPARALVAGEVVELADGRAGEHHPGFDAFHGTVDLTDDVGDIAATLIATDLQFPRLWVADIVEVDTIDIIAACDLGTETGQIIARLRHLRVHIPLVANLTDEIRILLTDELTAIGVPLAHRDGDNPGMALHAPLVALVDAELQGIVTGRLTRVACEADIPRFIGIGEDDRSPDTSLKHDSVDIGLTQLVENGCELLTLLVS